MENYREKVESSLSVEVAYAKPEEQVILLVQLEKGSTVEAAIRQSGILERFPDIDLGRQGVGVFSKPRKLTDLVLEGERIEIYRPLLMDPKEARRKRQKQNRVVAKAPAQPQP